MSLKASKTPNCQRGTVLVIALLMLLIMTLLAVSAMESSQINFKMSANSIYLDEAFNHSENVRNLTTEVIEDYLKEESWSDVNLPIGLTRAESNSDNQRTDDFMLNSLSYHHLSVQGDVYIVKGSVSHNYLGTSSAQLKGYSGAGFASGAAGGVIAYYEIRSKGRARYNATAWTASDYRFVK